MDKIGKIAEILGLIRHIPKKIKNSKICSLLFYNPYRGIQLSSFIFVDGISTCVILRKTHFCENWPKQQSKNRKIWTKNTKFWTNFSYIFLWRTCLTPNLQSSITFLSGKIVSFCKKRLFSDKKYFHISQTCKNDPGPPSRHGDMTPSNFDVMSDNLWRHNSVNGGDVILKLSQFTSLHRAYLLVIKFHDDQRSRTFWTKSSSI